MTEPTLETIEDYEGKESAQKRLTVWVVILSGLLIGAIYGIVASQASVPDRLAGHETTGIIKY